MLTLPNDSRETPWAAAWASFELDLQGSRRSALTLRTYRRAGNRFRDWLIAEGLPPDPLRVRPDHLRAFFAQLQEERTVKASTARLAFATLRRFFNFLVELEELDRSPMARLHAPVVNAPAPAILTDDEVSALLVACKGGGFFERRDTAIVRTFIDTGMRRSELLGLKLADVHLGEGWLEVMGKGERPGTVFLGARARRDLDRYRLARARHPWRDAPELWLGSKGPLQGWGLVYLLQRRAEAAGVEVQRVHPHAFRHYFAHQMKAQGVSDEDVMTLGRWKDPSVMRRYGGALALDRAREAHRKHSPGDRL